VAVFLLGAIVRFSNLDVALRSPDEKIYTSQAQVVLEGGVRGMRAVVGSFLRRPELWSYPPPNRVGYTFLLAAAMKLTGSADPAIGSYLSCLVSILTLGAAILLGLRFLGSWITVFGALFLAVFPPELAIARRCWSDALVGLGGVAMLYFALEIWAGAKKWPPYVLLPLAGSIAVLIKETSVLIYGSCLLAAFWAVAVRNRNFKHAAMLAGAAAGGALAGTALLALTTGGVDVPFEIIMNQVRSNAANTYALEYASGPGYLLLLALERLSPVTLVLALLAMIATTAAPWVPWLSGIRSHRLLAWLTIANLAVYMVVPHWLNLRYASATFAPLCLFAGVGAYGLFGMAREKLPAQLRVAAATVGIAVIGLSAAADYQRFEKAFVRALNLDLSVEVVILTNEE